MPGVPKAPESAAPSESPENGVENPPPSSSVPPLPARRTHRKSRTGCAICKRRKIKVRTRGPKGRNQHAGPSSGSGSGSPLTCFSATNDTRRVSTAYPMESSAPFSPQRRPTFHRSELSPRPSTQLPRLQRLRRHFSPQLNPMARTMSSHSWSWNFFTTSPPTPIRPSQPTPESAISGVSLWSSSA